MNKALRWRSATMAIEFRAESNRPLLTPVFSGLITVEHASKEIKKKKEAIGW